MEFLTKVDIKSLKDISGLCLVCLKENTMVHLLTDQFIAEKSFLIHEALAQLTNVKFDFDAPHPMFICPKCYELLQTSFKFKINFEHAQEILQDYFDEECAKTIFKRRSTMPFNRRNKEQAEVEIISESGNYNIQDLFIVEEPLKNTSNYEGFLRNLGKEITAEFVNVKQPTLQTQLRNSITVVKTEKEDTGINMLSVYTTAGLENKEFESKELENAEQSDDLDIMELMKTCQQGNKFQCKFCCKIYLSKQILKHHLHEIHKNKEVALCHMCGLIMISKLALHNHMLLKHREKKHACHICGKKYFTITHLKQHQVIHKSERCFLCTICGKSFNYANALQYHMRLHTGEKKYACSCCDKKFALQSGLKRHLRIHTAVKPFKCKYCDKSFRSTAETYCHEMIHTAYRPYKCKYCGKGFTKANKMQMHLLAHSGAHMCGICSKGCIDLDALKIHLKIIHGMFSL